MAELIAVSLRMHTPFSPEGIDESRDSISASNTHASESCVNIR
jgi:hypothetical protein